MVRTENSLCRDRIYGKIRYRITGEEIIELEGITPESLINAPANIKNPGNTLTGWYTANGVKWNFGSDRVTSDITLTARWEQLMVTYHLGYKEDGKTSSATIDGKAVAPTAPTREGYDFNGWWVSSNNGVTLNNYWDFGVDVTSNITLYADWVDAATIVGQLRAPSLSVSSDYTISWQPIAKSNGYDYEITYTDNGTQSFDNSYTTGTTYTYLKTAPARTYYVKVRARGNGETSVNSTFATRTVTVEKTSSVLDAPSGITYDYTTDSLQWKAVTNATKYTVEYRLNTTDDYILIDDNVTSSRLNMTENFPTGNVYFQITASGSGYTANSATYTFNNLRLAAPENAEIFGTQLSWDASLKADRYEIMIGTSQSTNTTSALTYNVGTLTTGTVIKLRARDTQTNYLASKWVEITYENLNGAAITAATSFDSGTGTSSNPYIIKTKEQLAYLAKLVNEGSDYSSSKYFKLAGNINLCNAGWTPIGFSVGSSNTSKMFRGSFNGNGFKIYNFQITETHLRDDADALYAGLFGYISAATINNLGITHASINITSTTTATVYAGALAGQATATAYSNYISGCYAEASITVKSANEVYAGGLVGFNGRATSVSGISYIQNSYTTGSVDASTTNGSGISAMAGLAGCNGYSGRISYCNSSATVSTALSKGTNYAGGLIGHNYGNGGFYCSYATGNVSLNSNKGTTVYSDAFTGYAGGFAGAVTSIAYDSSDCYALGNVFADSINTSQNVTVYAGGFAGYVQSSSNYWITTSYSAGSRIEAQAYNNAAYAGGFVGYVNSSYSGTVRYSFAYCGNVIAKVSATSGNRIAAAGGFAGYGTSSNVSNCYRYDSISLTSQIGTTSITPTNNTAASTATLSTMQGTSFYSTLGWSSTYWDYTNLNFSNRIFPTPKTA